MSSTSVAHSKYGLIPVTTDGDIVVLSLKLPKVIKKKFNEKDTTVLFFAGDCVCIVGRSNGVQMHLDCKDDTIFDWIASCLKSLNRANTLHC